MRASMGSGMLQSAAEILTLRPYWEQEYTNGLTGKQFEDWVRDPAVLQRYQNAPKIMPGQPPTSVRPLMQNVSALTQGQTQPSQEDQQLILMRMMQGL